MENDPLEQSMMTRYRAPYNTYRNRNLINLLRKLDTYGFVLMRLLKVAGASVRCFPALAHSRIVATTLYQLMQQ